MSKKKAKPESVLVTESMPEVTAVDAVAAIQTEESYEAEAADAAAATEPTAEPEVKAENLERELELALGRLNADRARYNTAAAKRDLGEVNAAEEAGKADAKAYAQLAEAIAFRDLARAEDPILAAVKAWGYDVKRLQYKAEANTLVKVADIVDVKRQLDILRFAQYCERKGSVILADPNWSHVCQKINMLLTLKVVLDLGGTAADAKEVSDSYDMADAARKVSLGGTPASNTQLLALLQVALSGMHPSFKATSHDVEYLKKLYSKKGKVALSVACSKHAAFRLLVQDIAHRCAVGTTRYGVEYQRKSK